MMICIPSYITYNDKIYGFKNDKFIEIFIDTI